MKIVVLSDKKPGHFKQSLGIIQNIPDCDSEWIDIVFKSKWRDNLLRAIIYMIGFVFGGIPLPTSVIHVLLRGSLDASSYDSLYVLQEADMILSTGSSVAAVNLLLGRLLNAKTVTCLRPSPVGVRHFNLAILPMLYWKKQKNRPTICKTIGIPNPISVEVLDSERSILQNVLKLKNRKRIGLLIGGTDKHETISLSDARELYNNCKSLATTHRLEFLLTTSRRTPPEVTRFLMLNFEKEAWCPIFVTPDTVSDIDDPYQAILALSDILFVSADSFSMVCEAASSGRSVFVLEFTHKTTHRLPKRYNTYHYMEENGILSLIKMNELHDAITDSIDSDTSMNILQDADKAVTAILEMMKTFNKV